MGVVAILHRVPRLLRRIRETARHILRARPDCLVTIDSPDFSLRVARRVRAGNPAIPIVHYVCPSVWAWRPGRAPAMKPYVDHILCVLPFEPAVLERLGGPPGTFVGHRLTQEPGLVAAAAAQARNRPAAAGRSKDAAGAAGLAPQRGQGPDRAVRARRWTCWPRAAMTFRVIVPTVPHVAAVVEAAAAGWVVKPQIVTRRGRQMARLRRSRRGADQIRNRLAGACAGACALRRRLQVRHGPAPDGRLADALVRVPAEHHRRSADRAGVLRRVRAGRRPSSGISSNCGPTRPTRAAQLAGFDGVAEGDCMSTARRGRPPPASSWTTRPVRRKPGVRDERDGRRRATN